MTAPRRSLALEWDDGTVEVLRTMHRDDVPRDHDGHLIVVERIGGSWFDVGASEVTR